MDTNVAAAFEANTLNSISVCGIEGVEHPPSFLLHFIPLFKDLFSVLVWFRVHSDTYLKVTSVKNDISLSSFHKFDLGEQDQL